ncbi:MAG: hypothetical protein AAF961_14330, partial [Planctomycetota bacterium]
IESFTGEGLIAPGNADESELVRRIKLPADDKKRMPKGADPMPQEEIDLIAAWVNQGAEFSAASLADDAPETEAPETGENADAETTPPPPDEVEPASEEALQQLRDSGASVLALFAGSPLLQVRFEPGADDASVADLTVAADQIVSLDVSGRELSEADLQAIGRLKNLQKLYLQKSSVSDDDLQHLLELKRLEYLNLYGAKLTDAALPHIEKLPALKRLYLFETEVSYENAMRLEQTISGLVVNLGWNHPGVVKARQAKQLAQAKQDAEEAASREKELQQQLEEVRVQLKDALERIEALEPTEEGETADGEAQEAESETGEEKPEEDSKA